MSLFGTSPDEPTAVTSAHKSKSSLFADESAGGSSSLFADDADDNSSPWNFQNNTVKRTGRRDLVRTLLPASDVPESYVDAYDLILNSGDRVGTGVGLTSAREILSSSGLRASDQGKIFNLVISGDQESSSGLGRGEFNVLLALIGLAQGGEDLSLDTVDDHRKSMLLCITLYERDLFSSNLYCIQSSPSLKAVSLISYGLVTTRHPIQRTNGRPLLRPSQRHCKNRARHGPDRQDRSHWVAWSRTRGQVQNCIETTVTVRRLPNNI